MRILLTNDDGYRAPGLAVLEKIARTLSDDVWIVAPAEEQSGKGRSLTLNEPVRLQQFGDRRFAVTGTPTDSVMVALADILKDHRPDLILSGVNKGANLGEDVFYSGTIGAAMEGALAGIRSVALSQRYAGKNEDNSISFEAAEAWGERTLRPLLDLDWSPRTLVNVNFPPLAADLVKGTRVVSQGLRDYGRLRLDKRSDPRGNPYFWMAMGKVPHTPGENTDLEMTQDGYITVTPLHMDLTHRDSLAMLDAAYG